MLPASYLLPAAIVLALGGALACFAGYRLFRLVLGVYGFILGALITTSIVGAAGTTALVAAGLVGGLVGAVLIYAAYFIGVGLIGAGLAALATNAAWAGFGGEPPTAALVVLCVLGALGALSVARWVVIVGTSIAGAWTLIVGGAALLGDPASLQAATAGDVWVVYPLSGGWLHIALWFALALVGAIVQVTTTSKGGRRKGRS